jgi:hypothetical protein
LALAEFPGQTNRQHGGGKPANQAEDQLAAPR